MSDAARPRVAACFSGWQGRTVADAGESIRRHMVRPLQADVLLALCYLERDRCTSVSSCRVRERLSGLAPFARISLLRQLTVEELVPKMEGLPHWPGVVAAYNLKSRGLACVRNPEWSTSRGGQRRKASQYFHFLSHSKACIPLQPLTSPCR